MRRRRRRRGRSRRGSVWSVRRGRGRTRRGRGRVRPGVLRRGLIGAMMASRGGRRGGGRGRRGARERPGRRERVAPLLLPAELGTTPRGGERLLIPHRRSPAPPSPRAVTGEPHPLEGSPDRAREQSASTIGPFRVITAGAKNSALFLAAKPRRVTRLPHTFHVVHDRHRGPAPPLERLSRLYPPRMRPRRRPNVPSRPDDREG